MKNDYISVSLERKTIEYAECFSVPLFLFYCKISDPKTPVYYLWLQKYAMTTLNTQDPDWRTGGQGEYTIYIPELNQLPGNAERLLSCIVAPQLTSECQLFLGYLDTWELHFKLLEMGKREAAGLAGRFCTAFRN